MTSPELLLIEQLTRLANSITVFGLGALIIAALIRRWVVTRPTFEQFVAILEGQIAKCEERIAQVTKERDDALAGWKAQTEATNRLAAAIEESNRDKLQRRRYADGDRSGR